MNPKPLVAEFIGTFTLIFVGVSSIALNEMTHGAVGITGIALAHGLAIAVMASATGAVSGGHLNPAVTFGALITGKIRLPNAVGYVISQCLGAICAAGIVKLCYPASILAVVKMGTPGFGAGVTVDQALIMEAVLTFFLMFVVFGTAIDVRAPRVGALFIGLTITLGILAGAGITGAAINPARHIGPALLGGGMQHAWVYWVGPMLGAGIAAIIYHNVLAETELTIKR